MGETQKLGANAATCIVLDQSLRDFREVVGSYALPTLLRLGAGREARAGRRRRVAGGEPPADLRIFEHSGHCPMWEEPDRFNQVVGDWIAAR